MINKWRRRLSWQIVPTIVEQMLQSKDAKKLTRVTEAFLNRQSPGGGHRTQRLIDVVGDNLRG